jgi:hypothetical protein
MPFSMFSRAAHAIPYSDSNSGEQELGECPSSLIVLMGASVSYRKGKSASAVTLTC